MQWGRVARISIVALVMILVGLVAQPAWAAPPLPSSMAAIGDSITRAYDVCCAYGDHPGQSWSTGYASYDGIASHYERLKRGQPGDRRACLQRRGVRGQDGGRPYPG
jgi:hypothetical protein